MRYRPFPARKWGNATAAERATAIGIKPLARWFSGDAEPTPLIDIIGRIRIPALLIAANPAIHAGLGHPPGERLIAEAYANRIGANAALWYVSDVARESLLCKWYGLRTT